jgi:hypothetical protein
MRLLAVLLLLQAQDTAPPALVSVTARSEANKVTLLFTKPVDPATAEAAANYTIDNGVKVESASRGLDLKTVTLTTSPLSEGIPYTVRIKTVQDCAVPPVQVAPGTLKTFVFVKGLFGGAPKEEGHAARIPKFSKPVLFNAPEADPILAALQVFPKNSAWNEDISRRPVHPDSDKIVASVGKDKGFRYNLDMSFIIVPAAQPKIDVKIMPYSGESDKGPYPVPDNAPIEGWPSDGKTLEVAQQGGGSDRHMIVVDAAGGMLYEFYRAFKRPSGWEAAGEATFDLKTNKMRPRGWTSSDAAGLPIFPSLPRFEECERGVVDHAMRVTVAKTRRAFIYPANHQAGSSDAPAVPAMGQRFRLKAAVDIGGFPKHAQAIALGLKKHGMFVADNGGDWELSIPPDSRLKGLDALHKLKGSDFEVVVTTGENEAGR